MSVSDHDFQAAQPLDHPHETAPFHLGFPFVATPTIICRALVTDTDLPFLAAAFLHQRSAIQRFRLDPRKSRKLVTVRYRERSVRPFCKPTVAQPCDGFVGVDQ